MNATNTMQQVQELIASGRLFAGLQFDEAAHKYTVPDGTELRSVTGVLGLVKPPFDPDGQIAKRYAAKHRLSVETVKQMWEDAATLGKERGTACHQLAEAILYGMPRPELRPEHRTHERCTVQAAEWLRGNSRFVVIGIELRMLLLRLGLAGTCDLVVWDTANDFLEIWDWKTSKSIDGSNPYGERMLPPFNHLDRCNLVEYSLQIGIYREMLLEELRAHGVNTGKIKVRGRVAWLHKGEWMPERDLISTPSLRDEVEELLGLLQPSS